MASISAETFRVLAYTGTKYSLGYYPNPDGKATRFFVVSLLWSKGNGRELMMLAHEDEKTSFREGRPPRSQMTVVKAQKMRFALYHAVRKWGRRYGVDQF